MRRLVLSSLLCLTSCEQGRLPTFDELKHILTDEQPSLDADVTTTTQPQDCRASVDRAERRAESLRQSIREIDSALQQCGAWLKECEGRTSGR